MREARTAKRGADARGPSYGWRQRPRSLIDEGNDNPSTGREEEEGKARKRLLGQLGVEDTRQKKTINSWRIITAFRSSPRALWHGHKRRRIEGRSGKVRPTNVKIRGRCMKEKIKMSLERGVML